MPDADRRIVIADHDADEHEYLHQDFHHITWFLIRDFDEHLGADQTDAFLKRVGRTVYAPLIVQLGNEGLRALERHWRTVFEKEGGQFELSYEGEELVMTVGRCPAVAFLREHEAAVTDRFCATTKIVNAAICETAGYSCSCEHDAAARHCVQRFWKTPS
ncbi:MAG: hypothetical protein H8E44_08785 [Planctomycetes bacterium]|nr:hypothetical protein [Planctomycetota bacterium]MBL7043478.1 hypothetical protein [Pirellulaceae bacterium]